VKPKPLKNLQVKFLNFTVQLAKLYSAKDRASDGLGQEVAAGSDIRGAPL